MNAPVQPAFVNVEAIRKEVIAAASLPLHRATTLPRHAYVDEDYFQFESETVLKSGWLCVGHISQVKEAGNFLALDLLGPHSESRDDDRLRICRSALCLPDTGGDGRHRRSRSSTFPLRSSTGRGRPSRPTRG